MPGGITRAASFAGSTLSTRPRMANLWLKIKIWTKVILFGMLFVYILAFVLKNQQDVQVWVWYKNTIPSKTIVLALFAFTAGVVATILIRTTLVTLRQIRELQERSRTVKLER